MYSALISLLGYVHFIRIMYYYYYYVLQQNHSANTFVYFPIYSGYFCPPGTRWEHEFPCPKGSYNPVNGSDAPEDCLSCPQGQYCECKSQGEPFIGRIIKAPKKSPVPDLHSRCLRPAHRHFYLFFFLQLRQSLMFVFCSRSVDK